MCMPTCDAGKYIASEHSLIQPCLFLSFQVLVLPSFLTERHLGSFLSMSMMIWFAVQRTC